MTNLFLKSIMNFYHLTDKTLCVVLWLVAGHHLRYFIICRVTLELNCTPSSKASPTNRLGWIDLMSKIQLLLQLSSLYVYS